MIFLSENIENKFIDFHTSHTDPDPPVPLSVLKRVVLRQIRSFHAMKFNLLCKHVNYWGFFYSEL